MSRIFIRLALLLMLCSGTVRAGLDAAVLEGLASSDFETRIAAIEALALGEEAGSRVVAAMEAGEFGTVTMAPGAGEAGAETVVRAVLLQAGKVIDPASGETLDIAANEVTPLRLNNRLRRALATAKAGLTLENGTDAERRAAADVLLGSPSKALLPLFERVIQTEEISSIRDVVLQAAARVQLGSPDPAERLKAATALGTSADRAVITLLTPLVSREGDAWLEPDASVREAAETSIAAIERRVALAQVIATAFSGMSLGSILLLAALGLAITFGVMGVINMAHGELLMVGAYATFVVQGLFREHLPTYLDWYVVAAIPVAFFTAALVGVVMERTVLRYLYGRPLESLLATWGLSLVLIQTARVTFGPQNLELANPSWMSGSVEVMAGLSLPWNRIVILAFAVFVLVLIWLMMQKTRLGMFVRAVTQNRPMAGCVGVPTARVDTLAFAIGAGVAGLGGLALSQIANVGPAMGQGYIVDSFMVVVLGGVGQLAGAVWAALGLGIVAKFLEGWAGAVIAKILVLVFIIVFIQKRPQGLFALKGRFADS
ncbi:MAG: urea ABC transporter permease subunit UrtB [Zoogloeaceae bacterium]|nr:urea ABC transporter permease subunit UrtB [Zoogloeaceae bacterium]